MQFLQGEPLTVRSQGGTGSGANMMDFSHEPHRALLSDFLDAITHQRAPRVTADDVLKTHMLIDELLRKGQGSTA